MGVSCSHTLHLGEDLLCLITQRPAGVWDFMTGRLQYSLAHSSLGAIITHALVTEDGSHIVSAESGDILYWTLQDRSEIQYF